MHLNTLSSGEQIPENCVVCSSEEHCRNQMASTKFNEKGSYCDEDEISKHKSIKMHVNGKKGVKLLNAPQNLFWQESITC